MIAMTACRQLACKHCGLDIEGFSPYRKGEWRDRGNNTSCPHGDNAGRAHAPLLTNNHAQIAANARKPYADKIAAMVKERDALIEALRECATEREYNVEALRDVARRFCDNAPIVGRDKEFAAQVMQDYARSIRVARAALAKVQP